MKNILFLLVFFFSFHSFGQINRINGPWTGTISINGMNLNIVFNFKTEGENIIASMDSPDQGAFNIPIEKTWIKGDSVFILSDKLRADYKGAIQPGDSIITGTWNQNGYKLELNLHHQVNAVSKVIHPQEPKKPFPYKTEEIVFRNESAGIDLAGVISFPEGSGPFPAVVFVSGSGPQDRDEDVFGHKPFLVIADYLTKKGIAVLRYDDRGVGKSKGEFSGATTFDFADDAEAAFNYLLNRKEINSEKIGILGHSEGGLVAPIVASRNKEVAFIIMLAGPGVPGREIITMQSELISRVMGESAETISESSKINNLIFDILQKEKDSEKAREAIKTTLENFLSGPNSLSLADKEEIKNRMDDIIKRFNDNWMRSFLFFDPREALVKTSCPVLALNGEKDLQVPPDQNLPVIKAALEEGGNNNFEIRKVDGVNHIFQHCKTGAPIEYGQIEETFSPEVLEIIVQWLNKIIV